MKALLAKPLEVANGKKGLMAVAALSTAILLLGALLPGYYVWTVNYDIKPLTHDEKIHLPPTTGATIDQYIKIWWPLREAIKSPSSTIIKVNGQEVNVTGFPEQYEKFIAECERYVKELIENKTAYLEEINYTAPILLPTFGTEFIVNEYPKKLDIAKPVDVVFQIPASDAHAVQDHYWLLIVFIGVFEQGDTDGDGTPWELVGIDILIPSLFQVDDWKDLVSVVNLDVEGDYEVILKIFAWTGAVPSPVRGEFDILIYAVEKPL